MRRRPSRVREGLVVAGLVGALFAVHLVATRDHGYALPDSTREVVGASAKTVWSRFHAHFTAPFFHDSLFHLAYNSVILALALPVALRAFGPTALLAGYLASPLAGILVDLLIILPLAGAGWASAAATAQARLVGASVVAFALAGMALVALAPRLGLLAPVLVGALVAYEVLLATLGITRPFVWAYHLAGLGLGLLVARTLLARVG